MTAAANRRQGLRSPVLWVAVVSVLSVSLVALRIYVDSDNDITAFVAFGEDDRVTAGYGREVLGREVYLRDGLGHDGRFFFIQANDPLLLEPEQNALFLDRPVYRSQRMLYPTLAGGFGVLSPDAVAWALLAVNLAAMGAGAWAVGEIARELGGSPWWGLAFPLNVGLISEMSIDGAGVLAAAAAFGAIALLMKGRVTGGVVLVVAAALSREAMLLVAAGAALWLWRRDERREAALMAVAPVAAVGLWAVFLRLRLDSGSGLSEVQEIGWPFVGVTRAFSSWIGDPIDLAVGVVLLLLLVLFARRALVSDTLLGWSTVGFVALALLLTEQVWRNYFDITRAVAPILTAFVLLVFLGGRELKSEEHPSSRSTESSREGATGPN